MRYFIVIEDRGPSWNRARSRPEQDKWAEHATFMDALVEEGFVVLGGPFGDGVLVMLIVNTDSEAQVERRLADDPWIQMGILTIASVQPWQLLLGDAPS